MTNLGMLGLGNDSETTAQYGGTIHAGDIGTAAEDEYGLDTSIGTGRRLGQVTRILHQADPGRLCGKLRVMFWILQDYQGRAVKYVNNLLKEYGKNVNAEVLDLTEADVSRCLACDICPTHVGPDSEYRCIIKKAGDLFLQIHKKFLDHDLIVPVAYSSKDRTGLRSVYQRFIERTRYLRRGDYLFTDIPVMPLIFEELGVGENMHIRMVTSIIRHHTIMLKSNICYIHKGELLNKQEIVNGWNIAIDQATKVAVGRMSLIHKSDHATYNPVGYILSVDKDKEKSVAERRKIIHEDRTERSHSDAKKRLKISD